MNRRMTTAMGLFAVAGLALPVLAQGGNGNGGSGSGGSDAGQDDPFANLPASIVLGGTVRDFREGHLPGGHDDFELKPSAGFAHYIGMVADELDADGKPVFASTGYKVSTQWRNSEGLNICPPKGYISSDAGDQAGSSSGSQGGACTTAENLSQWFRDVPGVNMSDAFPITLQREAGTNRYVFDDKLDTHFASMGGFFVVNDKLFGNSKGGNKNFHFTYELQTEFIYEAGTGQRFTFKGDDDVWVFVDGKLVIDIGGVHSVVEQSIDLDRLGWLVDGESYPLNFFFAERHRTQSNFRIETSIRLQDINVPTVSALYD